VGTAALLHDVGKIHEIYAPILRKPDKLTQEEWAIMQTHSIKSAELVGTVSHLRHLVAPVRNHHENWDGSGYPDGLAGEEIPLESRIIMFADTIDAMTSDRPYRMALGEEAVRAEILRFRGKQFDPTICDRLLASPAFSLLFAPAQRELTPRINRAVIRRSRSRQIAGA
jgi:HD-GYP domain-containing protein (c-di-GMP phosphodiesterase class II)